MMEEIKEKNIEKQSAAEEQMLKRSFSSFLKRQVVQIWCAVCPSSEKNLENFSFL